MEQFIADRIKKEAAASKESGIFKYNAYFINLKIYERYRKKVNEILLADGFEEIIID